MAHFTPHTQTLAATLWPAQSADLLRQLALVVAGSAIIGLGAQAEVPLWPVPMTLQTLAISVVAATLGFRLGIAAVVLYLIEGAVGLPVYAGGAGGLAKLVGPTGGFLFGFIIMAAIIGYAADKGWDRAWPKILAAMAVANVIVFVPGLLWLGIALPSLGFGAKLWAAGAAPFMVGTVVKTLLGAAIMPSAWALVRRLRG